ncbi:MAG: FtsX-like permease family protein, partial [Bacteroidota bacterium]
SLRTWRSLYSEGVRPVIFLKLVLKQIAEEVGYLSKSSFNTSFRKITGLTPSEYKDRNVCRDVREAKLERREPRGFRPELQPESTFEYIKNSTTMFSNFIKVYLRNISKNWLFSVINISGLCIGLISAILIYLYISHEVSYDRFHSGAENIYRLTLLSDNPQTRTPHPMAGQLVADFPQVESAVTLTPLYGPGLTLQSIYLRNPENNVLLRVPDGYAADTSFFSVFDFELLAGNPKTALNDVGSAVISESLAKQFFGDEDPMGKRIEGAADGGFGIVTGVMRDAPSNSHFHPKFIMSYNTLRSDPGNDRWMSWGDPGHFNYIKLRDGSKADDLLASLPEWVQSYGAQMPREMLDALRNGNISFGIQPIVDIHLSSDLRWELEPNSSQIYIYILMAAMIFILTIITVNFINLYAARSYERSKEVGIRKTLGASSGQLNLQFIGESFFTALIAMIVALSMVALLLPSFNDLSGKGFTVQSLLSTDLLTMAFLAALIIGVLGGVLASGGLSRSATTDILKGIIKGSGNTKAKRSALLGIQFVVSAIMIFGSVVILEQVKFLENRPMGLDAEELVILELQTDQQVRSLEAMKSELMQHPGITAVGGISNLPGGQFNRNDLFIEGAPNSRVGASELWVDYDALQVLGLSLKSGRWFDPASRLDSLGTNFIINETALSRLSLDGPGELIYWAAESGAVEGNIVGVLNDFNYKSLHEPIRPLLVMVGLRSINYLLIKINGQNVPETLDWIENVHGQFDKQFAADYWFMDDQLNRLYAAERNAFSIFNLFAGVALFLAAMGLLGTAYLTITQRKKEIGIRKVLGAHLGQLLILENRPFMIVVVAALVLGLPVGVLVMSEWLSEFAYHISIGVEPFFWTSVILVVVAVISVSLAVLRTVLQNPSEALRSE